VSDRPEPHPNRVFVDTSAYFALANERDINHHQAATTAARLRRESSRLYTTNFILAETHALLLSKLGRRTAFRVLAEIDRSDAFIVRVAAGDERQARVLLARYDDKDFSLTDATSFVVMDRLRIGQAFTFDHDFAQYGFSILGSA
jgi:predicted nucleic acid-binding protein